MAPTQFLCFPLLLLFIGFASSSFISYDGLDSRGSSGRTLLQIKKSCTEDMESKNYTILTSQCKGPQFPAKACCQALKEFACPFAEAINDATTDCASTMFSYINLYGKYPPGLFANQCKEGSEGLSCDDIVASVKAQTPSSTGLSSSSSPPQILMLAAALFGSLLHFF